MGHFISVKDVKDKEIMELIKHAVQIKKNPARFADALKQKTMLMLFEAPSLRTRLSFETGMTELGGHAIAYHLGESTAGKKESIEDLARVFSRYVDIAMARIYSHEMLVEIARNASVPVINGMTNLEHPCQVLSDLVTIYEKRRRLKGLKLAYVGDGFNNTTHSLLYGCPKVGMDISIGCPKNLMPDTKILLEADRIAKRNKTRIEITTAAEKAVKNADIVYTDSWMSYHVPESHERARKKILKPYQVNKNLMKHAPEALFMHCLPAKRGDEVTSEVMDSKLSVVYDQAENRLHAQKALILWLMGEM